MMRTFSKWESYLTPPVAKRQRPARCYIVGRWAIIVWIHFVFSDNYAKFSIGFRQQNLSGSRKLHFHRIRAYKNDIGYASVDGDGLDNQRVRSVQFISPLLKYGYRPAVDEFINYTTSSVSKQRKPILLFLPGFDGTFLSPFLQFPELHTIFDVRCMTVDTLDRSTYEELRYTIIEFLEREIGLGLPERLVLNATQQASNEAAASDSGNIVTNLLGSFLKGGSDRVQEKSVEMISEMRPVYLIGESFGGILASDIALTILDRNSKYVSDKQAATNTTLINFKGLVLVNAATCYDRSRLAAEGPKVAEMPNWLYPFGLLKLVPLFSDEYSLQQLLAILSGKALPSVIDNEIREAYLGRVALSLPFVIPFMTRETLQWRLSAWLSTGCERMASERLQILGTRHPALRTLIVAGENDKCLPSIAEAERLSSVLPDTIVHIVEGAGHASTCGSRVDLAALLRKRFPELISFHGEGLKEKAGLRNLWSNSGQIDPENLHTERTSMKETAANRSGVLFGMEPRYDNKTVGLSPLKYWDAEYYRKPPFNL